MDLSVIIVNYNTRELLKKCLKTVFASHISFSYEVLVVDNGSTDGSIEMLKSEFPEVKLSEAGANLGFSKANNIGIRNSWGRYVLLLNSDTEVRNNTFDACIRRLNQDQQIGVLGCKVLLPDGTLDKACRRRFPNPRNSFLRLFGLKKYSDYNIELPIDQEAAVDAVMGAFMMVPKRVIDRVGMLDEDYFMYGEDLDWCWRIKDAGYKIIYYPQAEITHYKYGTSKLIPLRTIRKAHDAMKIFYRKHYARNYSWIFNMFVYLGITLRMYLVLVVNFFRNKKRVH